MLAVADAWFGGDRCTSVSCTDPGSHYADELGQPYASDGAVMMAKTEGGRLIKIRLDLVSASPGGQSYVLQGIRGVFEHADGVGRVSFLEEQEGGDLRPGPWRPLEDAAGEDAAGSLQATDVQGML